MKPCREPGSAPSLMCAEYETPPKAQDNDAVGEWNDVGSPSRGMINGLVVSISLWAGIICFIRWLW